MLLHNWKCTLQSDLFTYFLLIVLCGSNNFRDCEAETFNANSLTRLWRMSESGNRVLLNKTNNNSLRSTFRNIGNDYIPNFLNIPIRRFNEKQKTIPLLLGSTNRAFSNSFPEKIFHPITQLLTVKPIDTNKKNSFDSIDINNYTTIKPYHGSSAMYHTKNYDSVSMRIPTTYKPNLSLSYLRSKKQLDIEHNSNSWNHSKTIPIPSPAYEEFTPRIIPINNDDYFVTKSPIKNTQVQPSKNEHIPHTKVDKLNESMFEKNISKMDNGFTGDDKYTETFIPSVTISSYRDPALSGTESSLSNKTSHAVSYNSTPSSLLVTDAFSPKEIEESRKSSIKKKYKKFMLPLLLAYKLKFFALLPLLMGGLVLLAGSTGMAGFFFALFAAVMGLKTHGGSH